MPAQLQTVLVPTPQPILPSLTVERPPSFLAGDLRLSILDTLVPAGLWCLKTIGWSLPAEPQSALSPGSISWGLDSTWHLLAHFSQRLDSGPDSWFHIIQGPQGPASTQAFRHQPPFPPPPPRLVAEPRALIPSPHFHPLPLLNANLGGIFWCQQIGNAEGEAIPR